jgi:hypothetical protein
MAASALGLALMLGAFALHAAEPTSADAKPGSRLSERQAERIAQQERLIDCNRHAREAKLRSGPRREFIRECLKKDSTAASGGGAAK